MPNTRLFAGGRSPGLCEPLAESHFTLSLPFRWKFNFAVAQHTTNTRTKRTKCRPKTTSSWGEKLAILEELHRAWREAGLWGRVWTLKQASAQIHSNPSTKMHNDSKTCPNKAKTATRFIHFPVHVLFRISGDVPAALARNACTMDCHIT